MCGFRSYLLHGRKQIKSPHEAKLRSGTLIVNFEERQQAFIENLNQSKIQFDSRVKGVRLSPHIYNTSNEIDQLLSCAPT
jgi:kynureninase